MALNYAYAILGTAFVCTGMIMDEEVLVLYAFILFVALAYHYCNSIVTDMIKTEATKIGKEFDLFFELQKKVIKSLITYHVLQVLVITQIQNLLKFSKGEVSRVISAKKATLDNNLVSQMEQKLSFLASKEQAIALKVQADASTYVTEKIHSIFVTENKEKQALKEKFLTENITKLQSL